MKKLISRRIAPYPRHPLLWALVDVCGVSLAGVTAATGVSRAVLLRADLGYPLRSDHQKALRSLLLRARDELTEDAPPLRDSPPSIRAYRRALFVALQRVIEDFAPRPAAPLRHTQLEADIRAAVGPAEREDLALTRLRRVHSATSARRAFARLGYVAQVRDGERWIVAPPAPSPRELPDPTHAVSGAPPRTPLQHRVFSAVSVYLGRMPTASADSRDVVRAVQERTGASVPAIYKIVRRMNIARRITGFGPSKRSVWSLPPPPPADSDDDGDVCGELGVVDGQSVRCVLPLDHDGGHSPRRRA